MEAPSTDHRKCWQAQIWSGMTPETLTRTYIYGSSIASLKQAASAWLFQNHPYCFGHASTFHSSNMLACPLQLAALYLERPIEEERAPALSPPALTMGNQATLSEERRSRNHQRSKRKKFSPRSAPSPAITVEEMQEGESAGDVAPREEASPAPPTEEAPTPPRPRKWCRVQADGRSLVVFEQVSEAVSHFLSHDLLPERGPDHEEESNILLDELLIHRVRTVKVIDGEEVVNHMLRRGGWRVFKILGKFVPAPRADHHVLFVLGHEEIGALWSHDDFLREGDIVRQDRSIIDNNDNRATSACWLKKIIALDFFELRQLRS